MSARRARVLATAWLSWCAVSCGASIRATYESDVRFEHCMALDSADAVQATLQRACWEEWTSFYTFGQTRDRIDYAWSRRKELGVPSDIGQGSAPPIKVATRVAPDPTSAIAPPPLMIASADGGIPAPPVDPKAAARARCASICGEARESCREICKRTQACDRACLAREARCTTRCDHAEP